MFRLAKLKKNANNGGEFLKLNASQTQTCWIQVFKQFNTVGIEIWFQLWV